MTPRIQRVFIAVLSAALSISAPVQAQSNTCKLIGEGEIDFPGVQDLTRRYDNGDVYVGQFYDGRRCGFGTYYFANGNISVGTWDTSLIKGTKSFKSGAIWRAEFGQDGIPRHSGKQDAVYVSPSGGVYVGSHDGWTRTGQGGHLYSNGAVYGGDFQAGKHNGQGKLCSPTAKNIFIGSFRNHKKDGEGAVLYDTGTHFEGVWRNNKVVFGFGKYKGDPSVFYSRNDKTQVRTPRQWCSANGYGNQVTDRCANAIYAKAALQKKGAISTPNDLDECNRLKSVLQRAEQIARRTISDAQQRRP